MVVIQVEDVYCSARSERFVVVDGRNFVVEVDVMFGGRYGSCFLSI